LDFDARRDIHTHFGGLQWYCGILTGQAQRSFVENCLIFDSFLSYRSIHREPVTHYSART